MDFTKNTRYFKSTDTLFYIGMPMLCVGGVLLLLDTLLYIYILPYQTYVGLALAVIGACLAFIPRSLRSSEADIENEIAKIAGEYTENCKEKLGVAGAMLSTTAVYTVGHYLYESENLIIRRGKSDRTPRSNFYAVSVIFLLSSGIFIFEKKFSLTEDMHTEKSYELPYENLQGVTLENEKLSHGEEKNIKMTTLVFTETDGETIRIAAKEGMETTDIVTKTEKTIARLKK